MDATIEVNDLHKRYGATVAVDDATFAVRPGEITGFVGPNGAGKSTTMRVVLGLDAPDRGEALVGGRRYRDIRDPLRTVGALLDASALHPARSARDHLRWMAYSNGIARARVDEVLEQAGLASVADKKAGGFSLGMQQRLGIASALLGDPPVLMFDEPMNGLDPEGFQWIRGLLRGLAADGRAVLVSSHLMNELEGSADHLVIIGRGRVLADRPVRELLTEASGERVAVRTSRQTEAMTALSNDGGTVTAIDDEVVTVSGLPAQRVIETLAARDIAFTEVSAHRATLEDAYLELTRAAAEFATTSADGGRDA